MNSKTLTASQKKTRYLVELAMWIAITLILAFVPNIGYLPIGPFYVTIVHLPVIIGAIMLGPLAGGILGFVMGLTSVIQATLMVPVTAFMFSPFVPFGNGWSLVIAIIPRICIGLSAAYLFKLISIKDKHGYVASLVSGIAGSLVNTILVLGGAYIFFGQQFAEASGVTFDALFGVIMATVTTNGLIEAAVAAVAVTAITKALFIARKHM